jgi:hypothetical protein
MTVGTQAAMLTGFAFTALTKVNTTEDDSAISLTLQAAWVFFTMAGMLFEVMALIKSMQLSILAPGLALRGPENSMTHAVVILRTEYRYVHAFFLAGLFLFLVSVALFTGAFFTSAFGGLVSSLMSALIVFTIMLTIFDFRRVGRKLGWELIWGDPTGQTLPNLGKEAREPSETRTEHTRGESAVRRPPSHSRLPSFARTSRRISSARSRCASSMATNKAADPATVVCCPHGAPSATAAYAPSAAQVYGACGRLPWSFSCEHSVGRVSVRSKSACALPALPGRPVFDRRPEMAQQVAQMAQVADSLPCSAAQQLTTGRSSPPPAHIPHSASNPSAAAFAHGLLTNAFSCGPPPSATPPSFAPSTHAAQVRRTHSAPGTPSLSRRHASQSSAPGTPSMLRPPRPPMPGHLAAAAAAAAAARHASEGGATPPEPPMSGVASGRRDTWPDGTPVQEHFFEAVSSWIGASFKRPDEAAAGAGGAQDRSRMYASAAHRLVSPAPPVLIDCSELGGASRSVSWSMPAEATLRDAREAAARRLGAGAEEMTMLIDGKQLGSEYMHMALGVLRDDDTRPLRLLVAGGVRPAA